MTEYNPGQPTPADITIDDESGTIHVDGVRFPWAVVGSAVQHGNIAGSDPWVRFQVPASLVRRVTEDGVPTVYTRDAPPYIDPDWEPIEDE